MKALTATRRTISGSYERVDGLTENPPISRPDYATALLRSDHAFPLRGLVQKEAVIEEAKEQLPYSN